MITYDIDLWQQLKNLLLELFKSHFPPKDIKTKFFPKKVMTVFFKTLCWAANLFEK